jgi:hypothetical protein
MLLGTVPVYAQGVHWVDHPVLNQAGQPVGGATITVCSPSAATNVFPCTPKTTIYSNLALTVVAPNPLTADARGNYDFYVTPGNYLITISGPSVQPYDEFLTLNSGSGGANPGGNQGDLQLNAGSLTLGPAAVHDTGSQLQITESSCDSGPRPWIDVTCPPYNAKGDGSTDDTAAISSAIIASCATLTGDNFFTMHPAVLFPPGVYRVQQPQLPSVFPVFNLPSGCAFLEIRGLTGGSDFQFGNPAAMIVVLPGTNPNNAPVFQLNNGNQDSSFKDLAMVGYNQAVYVNNTNHVTFDNAPMSVAITGQADNTPLKLTNMLEVYRVNHSNASFQGVSTTLPPVIYTIESGTQPFLSIIKTSDVTDAGGAEQVIIRSQFSGGAAINEMIFRDVQNEDSSNGWLTISNTSGTAGQGLGPFIFDRVTIEDANGPSPVLTLNDSTSTLNNVWLLDVNYGLTLAPVVQVLAGHMVSFNCFGPQCQVVDANGNATGQGRSNEQYGGTDHVSDNSFEIAQPTSALFPTPLLGIGGGPTLADRWCASGGLFCNIGIDPAFGVLFGLGDTNAFNSGLEQTIKESLDVQVAKVLPPTSPLGTATTGGSLAAGTYYAQFYTTSSTTCDRTFSITSSPSYTSPVSVSGANNAITYSWTLPVTTPLTPGGYCVEVQTTPIVSSSLITSAFFISGGTTTSFLYTGQALTTLTPVPAANQLISVARFTNSSLDVSGAINSHLDTGTTNALVITTPLTLSSIPTGMPLNVKVANPNTSAVTINLNGLGAVQATKQNGAALVFGDLCANHEYSFVYNGTSWDLTTPSCTAPISGVSSVSGDSGSIITNSSSTGAVTLVFGTESAHTVLAGPASGAAATPTFQTAPTIAVTNMTGTGAFNTSGNAGTATNAANLTGCVPVNAGDICVWTGSAWADVTGNNSGTQYLQETSVGVASWTTPSGAGTVTHSTGALTSGQPVLGNGSADVKVGPINLAGGSSFVTGLLPIANLASDSLTVNSQSCVLGSTCTIPFLINAVNQTSQAGLNLTTSTANTMGITITPVNTSGIIEKEEASGTVNTTSGGTGASAPAAHAVPIAEGASAFNFVTPGVSGTVLTSNGAAADPTYQATLVDPCTTLGCFIYGGAGGAATALNGPTSPNGVPQYILETPSGGAATAPTFGLAGVVVNPNSETTCGIQTLSVLDRAGVIFCAGTSTSTFTFPVHTAAGFGQALPVLIVNNNSGKMTLAPTTDTIDNANLFSNWADFIYNNSSGNWQSVQVPQFSAFPNTGAGNALTFNTATGQFGTISAGSGGGGTYPLTVAGTVTSGGIPYFSNTTTQTSSGLLASGQFVLGGGAGGAPTTSFSVVPVANGGTGTGSTLTGLVRGNASAMTAAEISGDCTTSGSNAITCTKINGTSVTGANGDVTTYGAGNTLADSGILGTNIVRKDAANTGAAAMTLNMSASTTSNSLQIPSQAGLTSNGTASIGYDTTGKNFHCPINGADALCAGEASAITSGFIPKSSSSTIALLAKSALDDGATTANTLTYTGTSGMAAPIFTATGTTAGFLDLPQGSSSSGVAPCNTANSICWQAPTSVTSQLRVLAGAPATGFPLYTNSSGTMTETITPVEGTISTGPALFGSTAVNTVVAQTIAVAAGHFTNLTMTAALGGSCTTAPTFNVFDGTSNTGTAKIATSTTQTKGNATSQTQTLTYAAGDLIGIYISTAGATCTTDTWVVSAEYSTP